MRRYARVLVSALFTIILLGSTCAPLSAAQIDVVRDPASLSLLMDEAMLLTPSQAADLRAKLEELSNRHQADIVIVTVNSLGGISPMVFADDYFDYNGYGRGPNHDGILLLISMAERDWWISTTGSAIFAFSDAGIDYIGDRITSGGLSDGDYAGAFTLFADLADSFFTKAATGHPFDIGHMPKTLGDLLLFLMMGLAGGLIIALIVTGSMQRKLTSVRFQKQALDYILPGSLIINQSRDEFLGTSVSKTLIPRETSSSGGGGGGSSTHTSSSGSSHGGGGGKF